MSKIAVTSANCLSGDGKVFLGGSCNPTTWRRDVVVPALEAAGVGFFNPQIDDWSAEFENDVEKPAKQQAHALLFVIDGQTRAVSSMVEVSAYMAAGREVYLVVQDIADGLEIRGQKITGRELDDLNRGREYVRSVAREFGYDIYEDSATATAAIVSDYGR